MDAASVRGYEALIIEDSERLPARLADDDWRALLEQFVAREGHAAVPQAHREMVPTAWRIRQTREAYRKGLLSAKRIAQLEAIEGWTWGTP